MATTLTFDTHNLIARLKEAGMDEKQAIAITEGLKEVRRADFEQLVTKDYLDSKLSKLKSDLLFILLGQVAVFAVVVKLIIEL